MVTHGALVHNIVTMRRDLRPTPGSSVASWMPQVQSRACSGTCKVRNTLIEMSFADSSQTHLPLQYHDFGLIVMMLFPTYVGLHAVIMSPFSFLKDPLLWLRQITL